MTPLWTTATTPLPPRCGWAFASVAGRAWPSGVAEADVAGRRRFLQLGGELVDAAGRLGDAKAAAVVDRDDAGAVVAAVFEPAQTFDRKSTPRWGRHNRRCRT